MILSGDTHIFFMSQTNNKKKLKNKKKNEKYQLKEFFQNPTKSGSFYIDLTLRIIVTCKKNLTFIILFARLG